eukprot:TRINITY_DN3616_c0_g1_i1.p1 TRINITY_DN3616_c0_g1~~TRINITY_DN3616_c0_g1_i1.p1  ORF type:complete len:318 (+),score=71.06 TRINITY_DN3616_c0_g1_i1:64-1017(+)
MYRRQAARGRWRRWASAATPPEVRIHVLDGYISQLYVCEYPTRRETVLLDAGCACDYDTVRRYVADAIAPAWGEGVAANGVSLVLSTHAHCDHVGAVHRHLHAGTPCMVADRYEEFYAGVRGSVQRCIDNALAVFVARRLGKPAGFRHVWYPKQLPESPHLSAARLTDGLRVPGFEDWVAVHIPGHTGHMHALYHTPSHTLYAADLMIHRKGQFWAPVGVELPEAYRHTLRRLRALPVRTLLLPHGGVVDVAAAGGWPAVLDGVARHAAAPGSSWMQAVDAALIGWGREHVRFDPAAQLPRGPLPLSAAVPQPVVLV